MKRLLAAVLTVGLLTACGSTTAPETPVDTGPVYPNLSGTWSDIDAPTTFCGVTFNKYIGFSFSQADAKLGGQMLWRSERDGTAHSDPIDGRVSTTGRATGIILNGSNSDFELRLNDDKSILSGQLVSPIADCGNGTFDRIIITMDLERE